MVEILKSDSITEFFNKKSIPIFILSFIENIRDEKFLIADSGQIWDATDAKLSRYVDTLASESDKKSLTPKIDSGRIKLTSSDIDLHLPDKKLIVFGIGNRTAFISFFKGGFVAQRFFYIFYFNGTEVIDYWCGNPTISIEGTKQAILYMEEMQKQRVSRCQ